MQGKNAIIFHLSYPVVSTRNAGYGSNNTKTAKQLSMDINLFKEIAQKTLDLLAHAVFPAAVFVISANINFREFFDEFRKPLIFIRAFIVASIVVPLMTAGVVKLFDVPLLIAGIMLIAASAPGDSFVILEAKAKKGNVRLAAATMTLLCLTMPFTVPFWMGLFSRWFELHLAVPPVDLFEAIAPITILPIAAGIILRSFLPSCTNILQQCAEIIFKVAIVTVGIFALILGFEGLRHFTVPAVAAILLVVSLAIVFGYYAGGGERKDRISLALTASMGNFAVVILIAHLSYPGAHILAVAIAFVILRGLTILSWHLLLKLRLRTP